MRVRGRYLCLWPLCPDGQ
uniref:Uncharacterized protein n=1 Tax=Anguilla anguilla TaxID=7936 RepID=A0A0E9TCK2_ANGAN